MGPSPIDEDPIPDDLAEPKLPLVKHALVRIGKCFPRLTQHAQAILNYLLLGAWLEDHGFHIERRVKDRRELFAYIASRLNEPVLYLEFGVYRGASIDAWRRLLTHSGSRFVGFDSFEGMPEDFDSKTGVIKGDLNVGGMTPPINDARVEFVKGWFEDTLPTYRVPTHSQLVIHLDCDLYSATALTLKTLDPYIVPGVVILFDDMGQPQHEPRAFAEYMRESAKRFRLVAADLEDHYAFKCIA